MLMTEVMFAGLHANEQVSEHGGQPEHGCHLSAERHGGMSHGQ